MASRQGKVITRANVSERPNKGAVYMTYQWWIGACNELVAENLSPITKHRSINTVLSASNRLRIRNRLSIMLFRNIPVLSAVCVKQRKGVNPFVLI